VIHSISFWVYGAPKVAQDVIAMLPMGKRALLATINEYDRPPQYITAAKH